MPSALLAVLALAGCVVPAPTPLPEGTPLTFRATFDESDPCGARDLRSLRGEPATAVEGLRPARPDGTPVAVRVIRPGDPITEDYSATRVNLRIGADARVDTIDCG